MIPIPFISLENWDLLVLSRFNNTPMCLGPISSHILMTHVKQSPLQAFISHWWFPFQCFHIFRKCAQGSVTKNKRKHKSKVLSLTWCSLLFLFPFHILIHTAILSSLPFAVSLVSPTTFISPISRICWAFVPMYFTPSWSLGEKIQFRGHIKLDFWGQNGFPH